MKASSLIDSHAHLDINDFDPDRIQVIERAKSGGLSHIITVGTDFKSSVSACDIAEKHDIVYGTVGCHPHNADTCDSECLDKMIKMTERPKIVAWGEIGLDYYHNYSSPEEQKRVFFQQLCIANDLNLPVIVHDREAHQDILSALKKMGKGENKGVIHCFSGDISLANEFISLGYYISIPGTVTFSKVKNIREVATAIPLEYMMVETDAPFLAPVPRRGRRNEPVFVNYTAQEISRLRNIEFEEVAAKTSLNTMNLFNIT